MAYCLRCKSDTNINLKRVNEPGNICLNWKLLCLEPPAASTYIYVSRTAQLCASLNSMQRHILIPPFPRLIKHTHSAPATDSIPKSTSHPLLWFPQQTCAASAEAHTSIWPHIWNPWSQPLEPHQGLVQASLLKRAGVCESSRWTAGRELWAILVSGLS